MLDRAAISVVAGLLVIVLAWPAAAVLVWLNSVVPYFYVVPIGIAASVGVFLVDLLVRRK